MSEMIEARFGYSGEYKIPRGRKWSPVLLGASQFIEIDEITSVEAPVAYRISSGDPWDDQFELRLHAGSLWWPLYGNHGRLTAERFLSAAAQDWETAAAVLDPLGRTYDGVKQTFDERFRGRAVKDFRSDHEAQASQVRADASRLLFIDGLVHVNAGEPAWFAVYSNEARGSFDLLIGPSSLDRRDRNGCTMLCVDRGTRLTAARLGRAYGLDEVHELLPRLHADEVHRVSSITAMGVYTPGSAAVVCATAWAQYLWEVAWRYPDLRQLLPAVSGAKSNRPPPAGLPYREMLERYLQEADAVDSWRLPSSLSEAELIHARLASAENAQDASMEAAICEL